MGFLWRTPRLRLIHFSLLLLVIGCFFLGICISLSHAHTTLSPSPSSPSFSLMERVVMKEEKVVVVGKKEKKEGCEGSYNGYLPCSEHALGNVFLVLVYGALLVKAAMFISDGSELLLTVLKPGLIGGLLLPILGALPDSLIILACGIGGTKEEAQQKVMVGIGLLVGSTVMLLTLLWGACLILGRCDLEESRNHIWRAQNRKLTKGWNLCGTGIEVDHLTTISSRIMMVTVIPYIVAELPFIFHFSSKRNTPALVACVMAFFNLFAYCTNQVFSQWIQQRRKLKALETYRNLFVLKGLSMEGPQLVRNNGELDMETVQKLFHAIDGNKDNCLSNDEIHMFLNISTMNSKGLINLDDAIQNFMLDFDQGEDGLVSKDKFTLGLQKWIQRVLPRRTLQNCFQMEDLNSATKRAKNKLFKFVDSEEEEEDAIGHEKDEKGKKSTTKAQIIVKSMVLMIVGTILAGVFADPLVRSVNDLSNITRIPSFLISFIVLPFASNSSETISSLIFASRKRRRTTSLTYSQIYGGATMNNSLCLGIFLALVYFRNLVWDFSSEVLVVFIVTMVMGLISSLRHFFPLWMAIIALALYPLSLGLVAILDYIIGWA